MSWKFVLNGDVGVFESGAEVSIMAGKMGYRFFLFKNKVYFRDKISLHFYETGITKEDLF